MTLHVWFTQTYSSYPAPPGNNSRKITSAMATMLMGQTWRQLFRAAMDKNRNLTIYMHATERNTIFRWQVRFSILSRVTHHTGQVLQMTGRGSSHSRKAHTKRALKELQQTAPHVLLSGSVQTSLAAVRDIMVQHAVIHAPAQWRVRWF